MPEGKQRILFVDDEANVLLGLKRMLRGMRDRWEMHFAGSGGDALELMAQEPFDVVVTDMRMPGMTGAELLEQVKSLYPRTVRIVLSGQVEQEAMLGSLALTHQFIAKPCDAETLKDAINRSTALQNILADDSLKGVMSEMKSLPSLPALYHEMMQELRSPNGSMAKVGRIVSRDLGMSAKILQLVNSAYFGLPRAIADPVQATIYLGMESVRMLVLSVNIFKAIEETDIAGVNLEMVWGHSTFTAGLAKRIARAEGAQPRVMDFTFMAGMLHDVGLVVLAANLPDRFRETVESIRREGLTRYDSERRILTVTHGELGAYLLGLWGLQDPLVEAVCFHQNPSDCPNQEFSALTAVHVAEALQSEHPVFGGLDAGLEPDMDYLEKCGKSDRLPHWQDIYQKFLERGESDE